MGVEGACGARPTAGRLAANRVILEHSKKSTGRSASSWRRMCDGRRAARWCRCSRHRRPAGTSSSRVRRPRVDPGRSQARGHWCSVAPAVAGGRPGHAAARCRVQPMVQQPTVPSTEPLDRRCSGRSHGTGGRRQVPTSGSERFRVRRAGEHGFAEARARWTIMRSRYCEIIAVRPRKIVAAAIPRHRGTSGVPPAYGVCHRTPPWTASVTFGAQPGGGSTLTVQVSQNNSNPDCPHLKFTDVNRGEG
jgi:hypothetical protein